jgi:hypothetical protein
LCTSPNQSPFSGFRPSEQGYPNGFLSIQNVNTLLVRVNQVPFNLRTGYTQTWHLIIQRELMDGWVLDVGYVGTRGSKLMILGDLNQARPNAASENLTLQARRPIREFGYIQSAFDGGYLHYHAFQAKLERRFSGGFYLLNSFTWSKSIDNASGHLEAQNGDNSRVNMADLAGERGLSGYDQPFNNTTTLLYDVPFGRGRKYGASLHRAADFALCGWRLTAINFAASGTPVNLSYSPAAEFQVSGAPTYRPNITGNPLVPEAQRSPANWLNRDTVALPTDPSRPFGNAGRNIVRGPGLHQLNFGLHKDFVITESRRFEFRMEAFNFLNKTNFSNPNGNRSSGAFGTVTATQPAREIQFALRYAF